MKKTVKLLVKEEIMEAVAALVEMLDSNGKAAGEAIIKMLADFSEENWYDLKDSGTVTEWLKQYIPDNSDAEYIRKLDVIAMLKEMQIDAAKCNGFIAGMVAQAWVIQNLLGEKIKSLGGTPYVKDSKLVDTEDEV